MTVYTKRPLYSFPCSKCSATINIGLEIGDVFVNTINEAIKVARTYDWIIGKNKNICPVCSGKETTND